MFTIRRARSDDKPFLEAMVYEAIFWDESRSRPDWTFFSAQPEFVRQLAGWGRDGDVAFIAEIAGEPIGAAWFRLWTVDEHRYGFVDVHTPELGIAIASPHRSQGVGTALLARLIGEAKLGYPAISLSVDPRNRALSFYQAHGFRELGESGTLWILVRSFD